VIFILLIKYFLALTIHYINLYFCRCSVPSVCFCLFTILSEHTWKAVYTGAFGSSVASSKWFFACRNIETRSASFTARGKEYCRSVTGRYVAVFLVFFRISTIILPILTSNVTQNFFHFPLTFLHLCLPKAASNTREHYYILILLCFSIFCPCFDFPLLRIFSSHFYYFLLQSLKNRILFQLKTKATAAPSFNGLASAPPFYFHLIRNRFSRSHANKIDDNLLSNTPIFWVVSVWLYPLLRISPFFLV